MHMGVLSVHLACACRGQKRDPLEPKLETVVTIKGAGNPTQVLCKQLVP